MKYPISAETQTLITRYFIAGVILIGLSFAMLLAFGLPQGFAQANQNNPLPALSAETDPACELEDYPAYPATECLINLPIVLNDQDFSTTPTPTMTPTMTPTPTPTPTATPTATPTLVGAYP